MNDAREFDGRVALVTGATKGIGAAVARALMERGATVHVNGRDPARTAEACEAFNAESSAGRAVPASGDVSDEAAVEAMIAGVVEDAGRIDVLVNNAGIPSRTTLQGTSSEHWNDVVGVNLTGVFLVTRAAIRHMLDGDQARIVNTSSFAAQFPGFARGAYAASKAAVEALTSSWAGELAPYGITVNAVAPGDIRTDIMADVLAGGEESLTRNIALRRLGEPEEVASVVMFLLSEAAAYVTGETVRVAGGKLVVQNPSAAWEHER